MGNNNYVQTTKSYITSLDSPSVDAFGRWRVSSPTTLFDVKQLHDKAPLFFDDQETSGSGTSSTYNTNQASTSLTVSATTAGTRVRQSFQRFNYQPGKSILIALTFSEFDASNGIRKRVGYFDEKNGLFVENDAGTVSMVRRTYTSGSAVDNKVAQKDWNIDTLDGTGRSGVTLDWTKGQILVIDFQWLGVGRVRMGFDIGGSVVYCHEFKNANNLSTVYISTPNLPVRYEINNDGTGAGDDLVQICSSVESEGGLEDIGTIFHKRSGDIGSLDADTEYALLGLRLQSDRLDRMVRVLSVSLLSSSVNDQLRWDLKWNPTVAGTFTYSDVTSTSMQAATGAVANTVTGGISIVGGFFTTSVPVAETLDSALHLGSAIDGTRDELVLTVTPITGTVTVYGSIEWREFS